MAAQFSQTTRSLAGESSRFAIAAWSVAGACMAVWAAWFGLGSVTVYEMSTGARLEVSHLASPVSAQVPGKVIETSLAIGAPVRAGDILVSLDDSSERLRLREEQVRLSALPRQIASFEREIESRELEKASDVQSAVAGSEAAQSRGREADVALELSRDYEARVKQLGASGLVAPMDVARAASERSRLAAVKDSLSSDAARTLMDVRTRTNQHDALIEGLRHSVTVLRGDMATAQATIDRLGADIEKHLVRAPVSGRLGDVAALRSGAYVTEGQRVATIIPSGDLIVVAEFNPSLTLGRVRPGQRGRLRLDAFPWTQYGSVAVTVRDVAGEIRDGVVRVELLLEGNPASGITLQHGLSGSVEIGVEQVSPATLILRAAGLVLAPSVGQQPADTRVQR